MASPKQVGALTMASTMVFAVAQPFDNALIQRPKKIGPQNWSVDDLDDLPQRNDDIW